MRIFNIILILVFCVTCKVFAAEEGLFGTYTGVLVNERLNRQQLAKLELISVREMGGDIALQGILTLQLGGFDSGEYVSYHFHDVLFNFMSGRLTFVQTDQDIYIKEARIKDGVLTGEFSSSTGKVGYLKLGRNVSVQTNNLIEPLNGEYQGRCGSVRSRLQLYTYRSTSDSSRLGNPFGAYEVKGQLAKADPVLCEGSAKRFCVHAKLNSASYDYFNGNLVLNGSPYNYTCDVKGSSIKCGECEFSRISSEMAHPQYEYRIPAKDPFADMGVSGHKSKDASSMAGTYTGYVYHQHLQKYQPVELDVLTYQQPGSQGSVLMVSVHARLKFGASETEILNYRFDPIEFPNPLVKPQFILARPEADVDALLHVKDFEGGVIQGDWHSIIFGKVGSFVVTKNGSLPAIPKDQLVSSVSGSYEENGNRQHRDLILDLIVSPDRSPINSDNPFFPQNIRGWVWWKSGIIQKESIMQSSYDFYTGRVALIYKNERIIGGSLNLNNKTQLRRMGAGYGTYLQSYDLVPFKKNERINP